MILRDDEFIIILDYEHSYGRNELRRLKDCGVSTIMTFCYWQELEPERGVYQWGKFDDYFSEFAYVGMKLIVQPIGVPFWSPDRWFFKNKFGHTNVGRDILAENQYNTGYFRNAHLEAAAITFARFYSYWHSEAQDYTDGFLAALCNRYNSSHSLVATSFGQNGEYWFPNPGCVILLKVPPDESSLWCYDNAAIIDCCQKTGLWPGEDHDKTIAWIGKTLDEIIRRRMIIQANEHHEQFVQFTPYWEWDLPTGMMFWRDNIQLASTFANLYWILFSVFTNDHLIETAKTLAGKHRLIVGAEGCKNIVVNTQRAIDYGFRGVICGPKFYTWKQELAPWEFAEIEKACVVVGANR